MAVGILIKKSLAEDQAKLLNDEKLDKEHESMSKVQEGWKEMYRNLNQYFNFKHIHSFNL